MEEIMATLKESDKVTGKSHSWEVRRDHAHLDNLRDHLTRLKYYASLKLSGIG